MKKILFITQKRKDAIGIVDESVKKELKKIEHPFDFLEIHEKGNGTFNVIKNYIRNILLLWKKCYKYDKLYFTRENPYGIFVRLIYWRKYIVMTIHHVEDYWGKTIVGKLIFKTTNLFIAISEFTKSQLVELGVNKDKILVNYNGISEVYYPEPIDNFADYSYILYVGTEVPRKNTDLLLEVFSEVHKEYPELKLVKIGKPGSEEDKLRFDNKVKELGLEDSVIIKRNFIEDDELRKWYSNALCYISLSKLEGFGLTIPEAMACGCPVIASDIGPFREICGNRQILIDNQDIISAKKGIEKYITDSEFRENQILNTSELLKKFSWKLNSGRTIALLSNDHKQIFFVGEYVDQNSFGIYSNNLIKNIQNEVDEDFNIYDKREKIKNTGLIRLIKHILYTIKLFFKYNGKNEYVFYIHSFQITPPIFFKTNRIIIVHDLFFYDEDYLNQQSKFMRLYYKIHERGYKRAFNKCKNIVAISGATKEAIIKKFGQKLSNKIEVIYNGIDLTLFNTIIKNRKEEKYKYLLYVGSELERKNLEMIIKSFSIIHKKHKNIKLVKAPMEKNKLSRGRTLKYIQENNLKLGEDVMFIDKYLSDDDLVSLYQNAEIFLFPSLKEGFGFPILEAQSCGTPVITTNYKPMIELIPYKNMSVDPLNTDDIVNKVEKILTDNNLKNNMIKEGIEYSKKFGWEYTAKNFIKLFKKL